MPGEVGQKTLPIARPTDFLIEVAKGNVPGHSLVHKFGHGNIGNTITPIANALVYQTPTVATSLEFVSDDANDTANGTGAREITFQGIDSSYAECIFTIETNGLTSVALPTDLLRLYRWFVSASGTYATASFGSHVGNLTVRVAGAGATWSRIKNNPFPAAQSEISAYTVPDGFRALVVGQDIHVDSTKNAEIFLFKRTGIDKITAPFDPLRVVVHYVGMTGGNPEDFKAPVDSFPARTDFVYAGNVALGTADVTIHFTILLIADGY